MILDLIPLEVINHRLEETELCDDDRRGIRMLVGKVDSKLLITLPHALG